MLAQDTKDDLKLFIQAIKVQNLKEFFGQIKPVLDSEGFTPQDYLNALLDLAQENGLSDNLLSQLEEELASLTNKE